MVKKDSLSGSDLVNSVVYFGAVAWCQPCKFLHPLMEEFSGSFEGLNFVYVDADEAPHLLREYNVFSVPTVKVFVDGEEKESLTGLQGKNVFEKVFSQYAEVI